jgi:hypothetical protein
LKTFGRNKRRKLRVKINMSEAQLLKEIQQQMKEIQQLKINQKNIEKNQKNIERKLDKAIGNANGQPDAEDHIEVWNDQQDLPGDIRIGKVIKEAKTGRRGVRRIQVGKVEQIVGRKRTRTLEIMRELDRKHENLRYENRGGNKGSYLYYTG